MKNLVDEHLKTTVCIQTGTAVVMQTIIDGLN